MNTFQAVDHVEGRIVSAVHPNNGTGAGEIVAIPRCDPADIQQVHTVIFGSHIFPVETMEKQGDGSIRCRIAACMCYGSTSPGMHPAAQLSEGQFIGLSATVEGPHKMSDAKRAVETARVLRGYYIQAMTAVRTDPLWLSVEQKVTRRERRDRESRELAAKYGW